MEKREFKMKVINGKPVIQAQCEKVPNEKGGFDVVVHMPSLDLLNKITEE